MTVALNAVHTFLFGPAMIYIGLQPDSIPDSVFHVIFFTGVVVLTYHLYRAYFKLKEKQSAWVNWIHVFLVAPILLIIGYMKKDASRRYFEMMLMLGIAATGYHAVYLIREMMLL